MHVNNQQTQSIDTSVVHGTTRARYRRLVGGVARRNLNFIVASAALNVAAFRLHAQCAMRLQHAVRCFVQRRQRQRQVRTRTTAARVIACAWRCCHARTVVSILARAQQQRRSQQQSAAAAATRVIQRVVVAYRQQQRLLVRRTAATMRLVHWWRHTRRKRQQSVANACSKFDSVVIAIAVAIDSARVASPIDQVHVFGDAPVALRSEDNGVDAPVARTSNNEAQAEHMHAAAAAAVAQPTLRTNASATTAMLAPTAEWNGIAANANDDSDSDSNTVKLRCAASAVVHLDADAGPAAVAFIDVDTAPTAIAAVAEQQALVPLEHPSTLFRVPDVAHCRDVRLQSIESDDRSDCTSDDALARACYTGVAVSVAAADAVAAAHALVQRACLRYAIHRRAIAHAKQTVEARAGVQIQCVVRQRLALCRVRMMRRQAIDTLRVTLDSCWRNGDSVDPSSVESTSVNESDDSDDDDDARLLLLAQLSRSMHGHSLFTPESTTCLSSNTPVPPFLPTRQGLLPPGVRLSGNSSSLWRWSWRTESWESTE